MNVEETMGAHGFSLSLGCSGEGSYTKHVKTQGKRAYVSVTTVDGNGFPTSMEEPVTVVVYDSKSGDELGPGLSFDSLSAYLDSLGE
jgi:hypothetical protein